MTTKCTSFSLAILFVTVILITSVRVTHAANISFVGSVADNAGSQATEFYSQTFAKTLDADGDDRYGTDGYDLFGSQGVVIPYQTFVSIGAGIAILPSSASYTAVDRAAVAAPHDPKLNLGTSTGGLGASTKSAVITYEITNAALVPDGYRIGIFTDGLDGAGFSSTQIYVEQTAGVGAGAAQVDTSTVLNNTLDLFFFDLTNVQNGDRYTISVDTPAGGNFATLQGVVFDSLPAPAPEPSTLLLAVLGLVGLALRRRTRNR